MCTHYKNIHLALTMEIYRSFQWNEQTIIHLMHFDANKGFISIPCHIFFKKQYKIFVG